MPSVSRPFPSTLPVHPAGHSEEFKTHSARSCQRQGPLKPKVSQHRSKDDGSSAAKLKQELRASKE
tara:strand:+ start:23932 stop:24129 length:198 start_codon:yes stop_codon:yes gene_type:complete